MSETVKRPAEYDNYNCRESHTKRVRRDSSNLLDPSDSDATSNVVTGNVSVRTGAGDVISTSGTQCLYGTLPSVRCLVLSDEKTLSRDSLATTRLSNRFVRFELQYQRHRCMLACINGQPLASVNNQAAAALIRLRDVPSIEVIAYAETTDDALPLAPSSKRTERLLLIHVNVYGDIDQSSITGALLSDSGLFLQDPIYHNENIPYHNPQVIVFPLSEDDILLEKLSLNSRGSKGAASSADWSIVLDQLPAHHVSRSEADNTHLTAQLMRHQLDAQDFMLKREIGMIEDVRKFWRRVSITENLPVYQHVVTGEEAVQPVEPRNGILADHMGLGKTLTTLAVIASSLERARNFANKPLRSVSLRCGGMATLARATLVIAPSLLILDGWINEIVDRVEPGILNFTRYHAHERVKHFSELLQYDIVFTTYGTVTTEFRRSRSREVLYHLNWFRIVLDEGHTIRSRNTKQFIAVMALRAEHYWCLTGTPISNKVEDLGALLQFCRVPLLQEPACFREHIVKSTRRSFRLGCQAVQKALSPLCLRRTRNLIDLPEPVRTEMTISFSPQEREDYRSIAHNSRRALDDVVSGRDESRSTHIVLEAILRLRIFCNHGTSRPRLGAYRCDSQDYLDPDEALTLLQEKDEDHCSSCQSEIVLINQAQDARSGLAMACSHILCFECRADLASGGANRQATCPICDKIVEADKIGNDGDGSMHSESILPNSPAKLDALVINLGEYQHREKSLVFSAWKKTIDMVSTMCDSRGIKHVCIHGQTPQAGRSQAIRDFTEDKSTSVLLMTLGTGALGLNLTAATRIHIVEPQWNPAVEEQAIGRAIRIGQASRTTVIRYVVKDSVEEHIQTYQKRKIMLAAGGFGDKLDTETADAHTRLLTATFLRDI